LGTEDDAGFPRLSAPARRALAAAGYTRLDQLAQLSEADVEKLHGMGPAALAALRGALEQRGLAFRTREPAPGHPDPAPAPAAEIDDYLRDLDEPKRGTLESLRRTILEVVPQAEQVISYRVPAFRVDGKTIAGFAAFKDHLSYLPFSGSVLGQLADELDGYTMTKSALHFPIDRPLSKELVRKLIELRLADLRA
jgi:uncharacterized protein YdhG (YjbR/CyaY superfamily)